MQQPHRQHPTLIRPASPVYQLLLVLKMPREMLTLLKGLPAILNPLVIVQSLWLLEDIVIGRKTNTFIFLISWQN